MPGIWREVRASKVALGHVAEELLALRVVAVELDVLVDQEELFGVAGRSSCRLDAGHADGSGQLGGGPARAAGSA